MAQQTKHSIGNAALKLIPNAKLTIQTIERTALDYLIGPLAMSFNHAFRQR
ncbi:MAG TPA: hypothetical protein VKH62_11810 [Candidatus Binatia bacterium]|nr:hypothetical protein [Candidatus Binatia bacterium]